MTFTTVFDAGRQGYSNWWFPAGGLVFVAYGFSRIYCPDLLLGPPGGRSFNRAIVVVASVWTFITFLITAMGSWGAGHRLEQGL